MASPKGRVAAWKSALGCRKARAISPVDSRGAEDMRRQLAQRVLDAVGGMIEPAEARSSHLLTAVTHERLTSTVSPGVSTTQVAISTARSWLSQPTTPKLTSTSFGSGYGRSVATGVLSDHWVTTRSNAHSCADAS